MRPTCLAARDPRALLAFVTHGTQPRHAVRAGAYRPTVNHDLRRLAIPAVPTRPAPAMPQAAHRIAEQALAITPAQAKALHARWSNTRVADLAAGLRAAQRTGRQAALQETTHREVRQHVLAAKLGHQAANPDLFAEHWAPIWDLLRITVPAAAVAIISAQHLTGTELLTLAGPWIELYGDPRRW